MPNFPIAQVRAQFPALAVTDEGRPRVYLDAVSSRGTKKTNVNSSSVGRDRSL